MREGGRQGGRGGDGGEVVHAGLMRAVGDVVEQAARRVVRHEGCREWDRAAAGGLQDLGGGGGGGAGRDRADAAAGAQDGEADFGGRGGGGAAADAGVPVAEGAVRAQPGSGRGVQEPTLRDSVLLLRGGAGGDCGHMTRRGGWGGGRPLPAGVHECRTLAAQGTAATLRVSITRVYSFVAVLELGFAVLCAAATASQGEKTSLGAAGAAEKGWSARQRVTASFRV